MALALALAVLSAACGGGGGGSPPPPPPPPVTVTVAPATQNVLLGATQTFTATVTNATSTSVTWSVNGITGGNSTVGTIDANGLYRGPAILPSPAAVTIRASSVSSPGTSGTATVTVTSDVVVSITAPAQNANVEVGAPQQVTKNVTSAGGAPDQNVNWGVSGNGCAGAACGTITTGGMFSAPGILPSTPNRDVTVTATSVADPSKSTTLALHIVANFGFTINSPPGNSINNATQFQFVPTFTPVPGSAPIQSVTWSVSGPPGGCVGTACGTIDQAGLYTAPNLAPFPADVTISAIPLADPSKAQSSPAVTINTIILVAIIPASLNIEIEGQQQFTANVGGTQNQNVTWNISGPNCANPGNPCGSISNPGPVVGTVPVIYTAPITIPSGGIGPITITATSAVPPNTSASVTPTYFSTIQASLLPSGSTRAVNHRQTLDAVLVRTTSGTAPVANAVDWTVIDSQNNRFPGGNTTVGQICVKAADGFPCTQTSVTQSGPPALPFQVDYRAPNLPPGAVTIEMRSQADASKFTTATVTVAATVAVNVSPGTSTLPINGTQQFTANVVGAANQNVTWSVSGTSCSGPGLVAGQCGTITSPGGLYTAPGGAPAGAVTVTATSVDDPLQSDSGTLTVAAGAFISKISPASITSLTAGSTDFLLKVQGLNFFAGAPGSGATIVLGTAPPTSLSTTCSTTVCTATITAASVTSPGDYGVQVVNPPGSPLPGASNQPLLKVLDAVTQRKDFASAPAIPVNAGPQPVCQVVTDSGCQNILVVEPTTAGSLTEHYNMDQIAVVSGIACNLRGTGITLTRPASGTQNFDICVENFTAVGPSLSVGDTFTISGPSPNDITIVQKQAFAGNSSIIQITLQIGSTTQTGPRTIFVENKNREKAALVGGIEVK